MRELWKTTKTVIWAVGILLSFFAVIELIRAYQILDELHPACGISFLVILGLGLAWLIYKLGSITRYPAPLIPPEDRNSAAYLKYQVRLLERLKANGRLEEEQQKIADKIGELKRVGRRDDYASVADDVEATVIGPCVGRLDDAARVEVAKSVRDISVAVALSPWKSADLAVVAFRNASMVLSISKIYASRPTLIDHMRILKDVGSIVATVNILNYGSKVIENAGSLLPVGGKWVDELAQGLGAGLLTSVAGHAAVHRCNIFRKYDEEEVRGTVANQLRNSVGDIKNIVLDALQARIPVEATKELISSVIEKTSSTMEVYVRDPAIKAGKGVASAGTGVANAVVKGATSVGRGIKAGGKKIGSTATRITKRKPPAGLDQLD
jgi:uncharacterized membrane protein YcjF (UPF0283 family)